MRILVADDDRVSRSILAHHLQQKGYEVLDACDGRQALEILNEHPDLNLLITDWVMPKMDGPELCRRIRKLKRGRYMHIIMLTSKGEKKDLLEGIQAGADAFLTKPFDAAELQAQILVAQRIIDLENQQARQVEDLTRYQQRTKEDLEAAAQVQRSLLPTEPPLVPGIEFAWIFDSCDEVAGDMFNVYRLDENQIGIYILDVSGHGVPAAFLSVSLSHGLNPMLHSGGLVKREISDSPGYEVVRPRVVAESLNRRFPLMSQSKQFFTLLYGILDISTQRFTFTRAGHPKPIHVSRSNIEVVSGGDGLPIGLFDNEEYEEQSILLAPGDKVILYTDGVEEARKEPGEEFGIDRLLQVLQANREQGIRDCVQALRNAVKEFTSGRSQEDDITILGFGLCPESLEKSGSG